MIIVADNRYASENYRENQLSVGGGENSFYFFREIYLTTD